MMEITAPSGLQGTLIPPFTGSYSVGSQKGQSGDYTIAGGAKVVIVEE